MKKYSLIYADPPWDVKMFKRKTRPNQQEHAYPMMTLEAIKSLPVANLAEEDCCLFLWTTQAYLKSAFDVMEAWGFKYQRVLTWDKQNGMCLFGFHHRTEFLLFGYKGKLDKFPKRKAVPTIFQISSKKLRHSEKPAEIREAIEVFALGGNKIELFSRCYPDGWDVWGNEVNSDIELNEV